MKQLLLGCGHSRKKRMGWDLTSSQPSRTWSKEWDDVVTLDVNMDVAPDLLCDLNTGYMTPDGIGTWIVNDHRASAFDCIDNASHPLMFIREDYFDEVHAYEILEHLGRQGDYVSFFNTFSNLYRILVPGGLVLATCPSRYSGWLWGDPGHTRAILPETLSFLDQTAYIEECDRKQTTRSDYRHIWKGDFRCLYSQDDKSMHAFILQAIKPART